MLNRSEICNTSPSRTYVAVCVTILSAHFYFRKFSLPEGFVNNDGEAFTYFRTHLNSLARCVGCIPFEHYSDFQDQEEINFANDKEAKLLLLESELTRCKKELSNQKKKA